MQSKRDSLQLIDMIGEVGGFQDAIFSLLSIFALTFSVQNYKSTLVNALKIANSKIKGLNFIQSQSTSNVQVNHLVVSTFEIFKMSFLYKCCLSNNRFDEIREAEDSLEE